MPFNAETYQVLIASPSDLEEKRLAATNAIGDWNAQHAVAESVVLLPVKWESHAVPQLGVRPQEAINRQLVGHCDILLGLFWTRIGTATRVADSGTVEEIDQFVALKKPALLYFSRRPIDPTKIDLEQHSRLVAFKQSTYDNGLVGSYAAIEELRHILIRDLTAVVRELQASRMRRKADKLEQASRITDLIRQHKELGISSEEYKRYKEDFLGPRPRLKMASTKLLRLPLLPSIGLRLSLRS